MLISTIICCRLRWTKLERTLFERALSILYANRLSRLTYEGTVQEHVQKIIYTEKSVAEMHHLLTTYTHWDISLSQWLHGLFISNLPDDYLASYIDILEVFTDLYFSLFDLSSMIILIIEIETNCSIICK